MNKKVSHINFETIKSKLIEIRKKNVLLDFEVAEIYGVETKRVNEAVKNNADKFPEDYLFELSKDEFKDLRSKISTAKLTKTRVSPKVFTEKGLYMLSTVLKSKQATSAAFTIIETFAKIRSLKQTIETLSLTPEKEKQQTLIQKGSEIITELLEGDLHNSEKETTIEFNFVVLKLKHTIKKT